MADDISPDERRERQHQMSSRILGSWTRGTMRVKRKLMKGKGIRALQIFLRDNGFDPGKLDGVFGKKTAAAVRSFQKANDLVVDGVVGRNTLRKIKGMTVEVPQPRLRPSPDGLAGPETGSPPSLADAAPPPAAAAPISPVQRLPLQPPAETMPPSVRVPGQGPGTTDIGGDLLAQQANREAQEAMGGPPGARTNQAMMAALEQGQPYEPRMGPPQSAHMGEPPPPPMGMPPQDQLAQALQQGPATRGLNPPQGQGMPMPQQPPPMPMPPQQLPQPPQGGQPPQGPQGPQPGQPPQPSGSPAQDAGLGPLISALIQLLNLNKDPGAQGDPAQPGIESGIKQALMQRGVR
jgi:peptidoglycan hydrolase-like protein with peptidoglycan-binding domain